jgi:trigger factor
MEKERAAVLAELRRELRIPGFRRGKVPPGFIEKNYADVIQTDAVRNMLPVVYEQGLGRERLHPLGEPRFENVAFADGGLKFDATIEVRPDVVLQGYDRVAVEAATRTIADEDVDRAIASVREQLAVFETVQRPATPTDTAVIDYAARRKASRSRAPRAAVALASENLSKSRAGLVEQKSTTRKSSAVYPADFGDRPGGKTRRFRCRWSR